MKASASRVALTLQNLAETICIGAGGRLERQGPGHFVPDTGIWIEDRIVSRSQPQIPLSQRAAQQNGLLLPNQPSSSSLTLHPISVSNHHIRNQT